MKALDPTITYAPTVPATNVIHVSDGKAGMPDGVVIKGDATHPTWFTTNPSDTMTAANSFVVAAGETEQLLLIAGETLYASSGDTSTFASVTPDILIMRGGVPGTSGTSGGGGGGVTDHGALTGLSDDDHSQYLLTDGTRALTGNLDLDGNDIINAGNVPTTIRTVAAAGADYTTVASALSDAVAGDTISLKAGESFAENITISTDRITLNSYGEGARPAITGTLANGINVTAEHVTIDGIAVTGWTQRGITSADAHYLTVRDCYTYGTDATGQAGNPNNGIRVVNSAATFVYGVVIEDCEIGQVGTTDLDDIYNVGVLLQECHAPIVRNNQFTDTKGYGIVLDSCAEARTYGNHLEGTTGGIAVWNASDNALIQRNRIANGTGMGIGVSYECDGVVVEDNLIFNLGAATNTWNGIDINNNCQNGLIRGNRVWGVARHCVVIDASDNPVSDGWTIEGNYLDARENTTHLDSRLLPLGIRDFNGTPAITFTENNNVFIPNTGFDGGDKVASEGTGDGTTYDLAGWRTATSQGADSRVPVDTDALYPMTGALDLGANDITSVGAIDPDTLTVPSGTPTTLRQLAGSNYRLVMGSDKGGGASMFFMPYTESSSDPTANHDSAGTAGDRNYHVGAFWFNNTSGTVFLLVDSTPTAAVWTEVITADGSAAMAGDLDLGGNDIVDIAALKDSTGAKFLDFVQGSTPVNYIRMQNTPSGTGPYVTAQGPADDIPLRFGAKGSEVVRFLSTVDMNGADITTGGGDITESTNLGVNITKYNEGTDSEFWVWSPAAGVDSGRALLYCHPWNDSPTADGTGIVQAAVARGDWAVTVRGATTMDPPPTGIFDDGTDTLWWDYHQAAMDQLEANNTYGSGTEWHIAGLSWGGYAAGFAACKSTQAVNGQVMSCFLSAAVTDVDEFYLDNAGFQTDLDAGFDPDLASRSGHSLVNFTTTELGRCDYWFIQTGALDTQVNTADHNTALVTAIGSNAHVRHVEEAGVNHSGMGIFMVQASRWEAFTETVTNFYQPEIDFADGSDLDQIAAGRTFWLGHKGNAAGGSWDEPTADWDGADTAGVGIKFREGDIVYALWTVFGFGNVYHCYDATAGAASWIQGYGPLTAAGIKTSDLGGTIISGQTIAPKQSAGAAPSSEGQIEYDTTANRLVARDDAGVEEIAFVSDTVEPSKPTSTMYGKSPIYTNWPGFHASIRQLTGSMVSGRAYWGSPIYARKDLTITELFLYVNGAATSSTKLEFFIHAVNPQDYEDLTAERYYSDTGLSVASAGLKTETGLSIAIPGDTWFMPGFMYTGTGDDLQLAARASYASDGMLTRWQSGASQTTAYHYRSSATISPFGSLTPPDVDISSTQVYQFLGGVWSYD